MELRQLDAFVAVARAGSFTRAADELGVVQPAVSQAVRRLENELGLTLLERTSRHVVPTAAGAAFLPHAEAVLARLAEARRAAAALAAGEAGIVRVAGTGGGVAALRRLRDMLSPDIRLEVVRVQPKPKLRAVLDGDLDAALTRSAPATAGLAFTELESQPVRAVVAADHPLAAAEQVSLAQLAPFPLAVVARRDPERRRAELEAICRAAGSEPAPGPALASYEDALAAIATSRAWTLTATGHGGDSARSGTVELSLSDELEPFRLWLAYRTRPTAATQRLLDSL